MKEDTLNDHTQHAHDKITSVWDVSLKLICCTAGSTCTTVQ